MMVPGGKWLAIGLALAGWGACFILEPTRPWLTNAAVVLAALAGAYLLAGFMSSRVAVVSFAIAGALSDLISVYRGPTRWIVESEEARSWLRYLAVGMDLDGRWIAIVGLGDLLFLGAFALALKRLGWSPATAVSVPLLGLLGAIGTGLLAGPLPGIPFMSATVLAFLWWAAVREKKSGS
jgi:hypothetical protein